ncbi:Uma2 family endonuclease [soil metagenome]
MVTTTTTPPPVAEMPECFRPLRSVEFQRLVELGLFEGTHVELVGGVLVEMSPQGPLHNTVIRRLTRLLVYAAGDAYEVGVQVPLDVDAITLPEPDFTIVPAGRFTDRHPDDAVLVIEVAMSSQRFDLGEKARRYAAAGFAEYWVIDLVRSYIHVHRDPSADGWGSVVRHHDGPLTAAALPDLTVAVEQVLSGTI